MLYNLCETTDVASPWEERVVLCVQCSHFSSGYCEDSPAPTTERKRHTLDTLGQWEERWWLKLIVPDHSLQPSTELAVEKLLLSAYPRRGKEVQWTHNNPTYWGLLEEAVSVSLVSQLLWDQHTFEHLKCILWEQRKWVGLPQRFENLWAGYMMMLFFSTRLIHED